MTLIRRYVPGPARNEDNQPLPEVVEEAWDEPFAVVTGEGWVHVHRGEGAGVMFRYVLHRSYPANSVVEIRWDE